MAWKLGWGWLGWDLGLGLGSIDLIIARTIQQLLSRSTNQRRAKPEAVQSKSELELAGAGAGAGHGRGHGGGMPPPR